MYIQITRAEHFSYHYVNYIWFRTKHIILVHFYIYNFMKYIYKCIYLFFYKLLCLHSSWNSSNTSENSKILLTFSLLYILIWWKYTYSKTFYITVAWSRRYILVPLKKYWQYLTTRKSHILGGFGEKCKFHKKLTSASVWQNLEDFFRISPWEIILKNKLY